MKNPGNDTNSASFRFYEELNDFLPFRRRKITFQYVFTGNPSVKDAIEAIGIPHAEVDLILVNGGPVNYSYKLRNEDQVSVYPVFESLNISGISPLRAKPLRDTKFVADVHMGRLSRYLRLCGFDTYYKMHLTDNDIIDRSLSEGRIILTRDKGLLKNKKVTHGYWVRSSDPKEQLTEVLKRFDLKKDMKPFTRCMECNATVEDVSKEEIGEQLPPKTRKYFMNFKKCNGCGKIYWEGSHYERMKKFIDGLNTQNISP